MITVSRSSLQPDDLTGAILDEVDARFAPTMACTLPAPRAGHRAVSARSDTSLRWMSATPESCAITLPLRDRRLPLSRSGLVQMAIQQVPISVPVRSRSGLALVMDGTLRIGPLHSNSAIAPRNGGRSH